MYLFTQETVNYYYKDFFQRAISPILNCDLMEELLKWHQLFYRMKLVYEALC